MKKTTLLVTVSLLLSASWAVSQTASFSFNDTTAPAGTLTDLNPAINAGTFNSGTGTFNIDVSLTFAGATSTGYSLWLETETGAASKISLTNETFFTFTTPTDSEAKPWNFTDSAGAHSGFLTDKSATQAGDLGATGTAQAAATYKVADLQLTLSGLAPGTYHLETTTLSPKPSEATVGGNDAFAAQSVYTITIVPEPATWSLLALGGLGTVGLNILRARKRA
jgi:PEP-CTERM motif